MVTDTQTAQIVYICTTATSGSTHPVSDSTHWSPYYMEIWATNSGSLTNFYIKVEYGCNPTVGNPQATFQIGTTCTSNSGVIGGNVSDVEMGLYTAGANASSECSFCSDGANYFCMMMWRNGSFPSYFGFERSISGTASGAPVYTSSYVTYVKGAYAGNGTWFQNSVFLSGGLAKSVRRSYPAVAAWFDVGSAMVNSITPAFPVLPSVGYVGNPLTILIGTAAADTTEGASITTPVYGTTHTYLTTVASWAKWINGTGTGMGFGMRFE